MRSFGWAKINNLKREKQHANNPCIRYLYSPFILLMISKSTLEFLTKLKKNNQREWFQKHKEEYLVAREEFENFIGRLLSNLQRFDKSLMGLEPKDCIFRIYRDVRFSKDKSPYKTHFGAHIVPGGKKNEMNRAGYYVHIEPGNHFLAGGAYYPPSEWMAAIRQEIAYNSAEFKRILRSDSFRKYFGEIEGERLSRPPRGYEKDHPEIDLLMYKSLLAVHQMNEKRVQAKDLEGYCSAAFRALKPFDDFLNRSMD